MADGNGNNNQQAGQSWLKRLFGSFGFFRGSKPELKAFKTLNLLSLSGQFNSQLPEYSNYLKDVGSVGGFAGNLIGILRNWHIAKFRYKLPKTVDFYQIESILFLYGAVAITKLPDKTFYVGVFKSETYDDYNYPVDIKVYIKGTKKWIKATVGKDAVILYHDYSFVWGKKLLGPLFKLWDYISKLELLDYLILNNAVVNRRLFSAPAKASQEELTLAQNAINSATNIIPSLRGITDVNSISKNASDEILTPADNTESYLATYKHFENLLFRSVGLNYNNVNKKERVNETELDIDNVLIKGIQNTEIQARLEGCRKFKEVFGETATVFINPELVEQKPENTVNDDKKKEKTNGR